MFRLGALTLLIGGLGHFLLVDLGTFWLRSSVSSWSPAPIALPALDHSTLDFGVLGSTPGIRAVEGFSLWVAVSLSLFGALFLVVAAQPTLALRTFTRFGVLLSICFGVIAAVCFIWPPPVGAALALLFFAGSWVRGET